MKISVSGLRTSTSDWEAVRNLPREHLPSLTPEQRQVAQKLRISEEDYALNTSEHRFDINIEIDGTPFPLRIEENIVDDRLESGSVNA